MNVDLYIYKVIKNKVTKKRNITDDIIIISNDKENFVYTINEKHKLVTSYDVVDKIEFLFDDPYKDDDSIFMREYYNQVDYNNILTSSLITKFYTMMNMIEYDSYNIPDVLEMILILWRITCIGENLNDKYIAALNKAYHLLKNWNSRM